MLVITRKPNERIVINDRISIVVLEAEGQRVKLGIKAPQEVTIYRQELYDAIQKENQLAIQKTGDLSLIEQLVARVFKKEAKKEGVQNEAN